MQLAHPTLEDIWRLFQETDRRFQETERLLKENAADFERRSQETDRKFQETERLLKDSAADFERRSQETDRVLTKLAKNLGDLGNRLGEFVEHLVAPAVIRLFQAWGIEVHEVHPGVAAKRQGEGIEIDLLIVNDRLLVAVECKSKLTRDHVDAHLARMDKLKRLLPAYRHHRALGAVAAMVMTDEVRDYAVRQGLYVLQQNGEQVEIGNPSGFEPRAW